MNGSSKSLRFSSRSYCRQPNSFDTQAPVPNQLNTKNSLRKISFLCTAQLMYRRIVAEDEVCVCTQPTMTALLVTDTAYI